jgi:hypothetical protein
MSRIQAFLWGPSGRPRPLDTERLPGDFVWVDAEDPTSDQLLQFVATLALPGLHKQMVWHLSSGVDPGNPLAAADYDGFDRAVAARLRAGIEYKLLQAFVPYSLQLGSGPDRHWSYAASRFGLLASTSWLITVRRRPFDQRFSFEPDALQVVSHTQIVDVVAPSLVRSDQLPADAGTLMLRWMAKECVSTTDDIATMVNRDALDFHRALAGESSGTLTEATARAQAALLDIRLTLEQHELALRPMLPDRSAQAESWYQNLRYPDVGNDVIALYTRALTEAREVRRTLADELSWVTVQQSSEVLSQNKEVLEKQGQANDRAERLQRLVGIITVFVFGPTLVATVFGAQTNWLASHPLARASALVGSMFVSVVLGVLLLWWWQPEQDPIYGPQGHPIYRRPYAVGMIINRRIASRR